MNRLKQLREEQKLSLTDLQNSIIERFGVKISRASLSNYERGEQTPKTDTWELLAEFFQVTPAYLMGLSPLREATDFFPVDRSTLTAQNQEILIQINDIFERLIHENNGWPAIQVANIFENIGKILDIAYLVDENYSPLDVLNSFSDLIKGISLGEYSELKDIEIYLKERNNIFQKLDNLFLNYLKN